MVELIKGVVMLVLLILSKAIENNAENKKKKEEIINALAKGIKDRDPSAVTIALDGLR